MNLKIKMESTLPVNTILLEKVNENEESKEWVKTSKGRDVLTVINKVKASSLEFDENVKIVPTRMRIEGKEFLTDNPIIIEIGEDIAEKGIIQRGDKKQFLLDPIRRKEMVKNRTQKEYLIVRYGKNGKPQKHREWLYKDTAEWVKAHPDSKLAKYKAKAMKIVKEMKKYGQLEDIEEYERIKDDYENADEDERAWLAEKDEIPEYQKMYEIRKELRPIKNKMEKYADLQDRYQTLGRFDFKESKDMDFVERYIAVPEYYTTKRGVDLGNTGVDGIGGKSIDDYMKDSEIQMWSNQGYGEYIIVSIIKRVVDWRSGISKENLKEGKLKIEQWMKIEISIMTKKNEITNKLVPTYVMVKMTLDEGNTKVNEIIGYMENIMSVQILYEEKQSHKESVAVERPLLPLEPAEQELYRTDIQGVQEERVEGNVEIQEDMSEDGERTPKLN